MPVFRILLVDDEASFLAATSALLVRRGFVVEICRDAFRALDLIGREDFDVIVIDVKMPMMEGDELLTQLRACRPETPVIVLSGHLSPALQEKLLQGGSAKVLAKPCPVEILLVALREALKRPHPPVDRSRAG